jgi:hypothetical protein
MKISQTLESIPSEKLVTATGGAAAQERPWQTPSPTNPNGPDIWKPEAVAGQWAGKWGGGAA